MKSTGIVRPVDSLGRVVLPIELRRLMNLEDNASLEIFVDGDDLYVLFESAAYAYSAASVNIVDRVLKLSLPRMEEYQKSTQNSVSQY